MRIKGIQTTAAGESVPVGCRRGTFARPEHTFRLPAMSVVLLLLLGAHAASAGPSSSASQHGGMYQPTEDLTLQPLTPSDTVERKTTGWLFNKPREKTAAKQLVLARRLEQDDHLGGAVDAFDDLVRCWPYAPEASGAQLRMAELNEKRGKYKRAFEDYRYLIHFYPEQVALAEILPRMFAIANEARARGKDERALLMFQQIADVAPQWSGTPRTLLQAGLLQMQEKDWYGAVDTFERLAANWPGTAEAETASAQAAHVLYRLSQRYAEDEAVQLRARAALAATLRDYPGHVDASLLQEEMAELDTRRYNRHYSMAVFYDNARFTTETAIAAYGDFVRRFPDAPQAEAARRRIEVLTASVPKRIFKTEE
jgi:outer membrane protein assembly factor BamD